ncbi:MAG: hypothetical protein WD424_11140, partial [Paenibacillaceae bacterium]
LRPHLNVVFSPLPFVKKNTSFNGGWKPWLSLKQYLVSHNKRAALSHLDFWDSPLSGLFVW